MIANDHRRLAAHQYAILNPLQLDQGQWDDIPTVPVVPPALKSKARILPRLLDLALLDDELRGALLDRADDWDAHNDAPFFSLLLKSGAAAEHVAAHLSRQLIVRAPDGSDALLRWCDPKVFRHLCWLLTSDQMRTISGPVSVWTWRDSGVRWVSYDVTGTAAAVSRLRLDARQWAVVGRMGVLNRTALQVARNAPALGLDDGLYRRIDACLEQAYDTHKLTDEADARLFAEQAVRHPYIHTLPEMTGRLARARRGEISYVGACAGLDIDSIYSQERNPLRKDAVT